VKYRHQLTKAPLHLVPGHRRPTARLTTKPTGLAPPRQVVRPHKQVATTLGLPARAPVRTVNLNSAP